MAAVLALPGAVHQHAAADPRQGAESLATFLGARLAAALADRDRASLLLSGGRSPLPMFEALSRQPLDWSRITIGLVDERCVPPDSEASNARLVREHLLRDGAAAARFVPLYADGLAPDAAATHAEAELATIAAPFDAVVFGMGDDGHTASLFPGARGTAAGLDPQQPRRVVATYPTSAPHARLSLTLRALLDSRVLVLAIAGAEKCAVLEAAAGAPVARLPVAAFLQQTRVPLHVFFSR